MAIHKYNLSTEFDTLADVAEYVDRCVSECFDFNAHDTIEKFDSLNDLVDTYTNDMLLSATQRKELITLCDTASIRRLVK